MGQLALWASTEQGDTLWIGNNSCTLHTRFRSDICHAVCGMENSKEDWHHCDCLWAKSASKSATTGLDGNDYHGASPVPIFARTYRLMNINCGRPRAECPGKNPGVTTDNCHVNFLTDDVFDSHFLGTRLVFFFLFSVIWNFFSRLLLWSPLEWRSKWRLIALTSGTGAVWW